MPSGYDNMKISRADIIPLKIPLEYPFYKPQPMETIFPVLVRLYTEGGLESSGVCFTFARQKSLVACIEDLKDMVVGTDVMKSEETWQRLFRATKSMGHKGYPVYALSAFDTAIWGLRASAAGVPLARLLGGFRDRVPAYGSHLLWRDRSIDELQKEGAWLVEKGFSMVKMNVGGRPVDEEMARVRAVREAVGPEVTIMVDANWAWSVDEAVRMGRMLEEEGVYWLEDPLTTEDPAQLAQVAAALDIPVATGENFHTKYGFRSLIEHRSADIFIIDLQSVGGVTEWMKVAAMAQAWNIPVSSHLFSAISVHLTAAVPNCLNIEYMPWWDRIYKRAPELKDGCLVVPEGPGLGIELDEKAIAKHRVA